MSGVLGIAQQIVLLYPPTQGGPFWQQKVFWACVWVAFVISMFVAWFLKNRELIAERNKHVYPDIRGRLLKVFFDAGMSEKDIETVCWYITLKIQLENHSETPSNITGHSVVVNTHRGSYLAVKVQAEHLAWNPDPELDYAGGEERLMDISLRGNEPLTRGRAESWWFRGRLPSEFVNDDVDKGFEENTKEIIFTLTDGLGRLHQIKSTPPWSRTGKIGKAMPLPVKYTTRYIGRD